MSPQRARKLKDTCDLCSVSKIKCERQWPQCSRCEKLGHQCIYSPARRQGRPHPTRKKAEKNSTGSIQRQEHKAVVSESTFIQNTPLVVQDGLTDTRVKNFHDHQQDSGPSVTGYRPNPPLDYRQFESAQQNQYYDDMKWFNLSTSPFSPETLLSPTESSNSRSTADSDRTVDTHSAKSSYSECSSNGSSEITDCTMVATDLLQTLTAASTQLLSQPPAVSSPFSHPDLKGTIFDKELDTASTAVKRLSAILICPCSENPDVGLLCIAVCTAILDAYSTILESCTDPTTNIAASTATSLANGLRDSVEWLDSVSLIQNMISNSNDLRLQDESQSRKTSQQSVIRRLLEELPKAANVVLQLTRRYHANGSSDQGPNGEMASLLPTMAAEQRVRLKDMVQKATGMSGTF